MAQHTLDLAVFRAAFPAFTATPDAEIQAQWDAAAVYFGTYDGVLLYGDRLQRALDLLAAHLLQVNIMLAAGGQTPTIGVLTSATIDKVTVSNMPPPVKSGWQYWLSTTPHGLQLWALLRVASAGGIYVGGGPERAAFRKAGGRF